MKILVTGSTGLLGRELIPKLADHHQVYALTRNKEIEEWVDNEKIIPIIADLSQLRDADLPEKVDAIYYLAQGRNFRTFPEAACETATINTLAPVHLAAWGLAKGATAFYYASTGSVYLPSERPISEDTSINWSTSKGFYPDSKSAAEILLRNFHNLYQSFAILRPFFIYGPLQEQTMLIPRLIKNIYAGERVFISGEDGFLLNPIFVTDAADACVKLLEMKGTHTYNLAGPEVITFGELVRIIGERIHKEPNVEHTDGPINNLIADIKLMQQDLISPMITIKEGIARTAKSVLSK